MVVRYAANPPLKGKSQADYRRLAGLETEVPARAPKQPESVPAVVGVPDARHPECAPLKANAVGAATDADGAGGAVEPAVPLTPEELERAEENRRAQQARNKRKARLAKIEAQNEADRLAADEEEGKTKRDARGNVIGTSGGVGAVRERLRREADQASRELTLPEKLHKVCYR